MKEKKYIIIPVQQIKEYIKENTKFGRFSKDGKFLIWDKIFEKETEDKIKNNPEIKLLTHAEALLEMQKENWQTEEKEL